MIALDPDMRTITMGVARFATREELDKCVDALMFAAEYFWPTPDEPEFNVSISVHSTRQNPPPQEVAAGRAPNPGPRNFGARRPMSPEQKRVLSEKMKRYHAEKRRGLQT